jgi:hypothetical protein
VLSVANVTTGTLTVAHGGIGISAGTSGGILGFTATGTIASSGVLTAHALVLGGGAGATPSPLGSLGSTTTVLHGNAAGAPTFAAVSLSADVSGLLPFANFATLAAISLFGNGTTAGATGGNIAVGTGLTLSPAGTLAVTSGGGSVTSVITQGGPFLASGSFTTSGTISNSTSSLTAHGVIIAEGTGAAVATAAMTNGQLLLGVTSADPAPQTMSGDATINAGGTIAVTKIGGATPATAANTGAVLNSGTVQINGSTTLVGTASGTVTIAPTTGMSDVLLNLASAGGAQTIAAAPAFQYQRCLLSIKQGPTVSTVSLNTGFVFGATGGPTSFTVTPTVNVRDTLMLWTPDATHWVVMAVNQGITI